MKLVIEIPDDFERDFKESPYSLPEGAKNQIQDSLGRVSFDIENRLKKGDVFENLSGNYEKEIIDMLSTALANAKTLDDVVATSEKSSSWKTPEDELPKEGEWVLTQDDNGTLYLATLGKRDPELINLIAHYRVDDLDKCPFVWEDDESVKHALSEMVAWHPLPEKYKVKEIDIAKKMLSLQDMLADDFKYKPLLPLMAEHYMQMYLDNLPDDFKGDISMLDVGYEVKGKEMPLYSKSGTLIANKYDRIVVGHYGAFIEISPDDICMENIQCKKGQEYRINDPKYSGVKYHWMTTKDDSDCKLYKQQKGVAYADYKPNMWYVSPYEVCDEKELSSLDAKETSIDEEEMEI